MAAARGTLETLADEVNQLKAEREAVQELKVHVEDQHKALTEGADEAEKSMYTCHLLASVIICCTCIVLNCVCFNVGQVVLHLLHGIVL